MEAQAQDSKPSLMYFRRGNKHSYSVTCDRTIDLKRVAQLISSKQAIPINQLQFYYKGEPLPLVNYQGHRGQIVHIINLEALDHPVLQVTVRAGSNISVHRVGPQTKVRSFIVDRISNLSTLPYFTLALVYLGKIMHPKKSMREELVEDGAELILVNLRDYIQQRPLNSNSIKEVLEFQETASAQPLKNPPSEVHQALEKQRKQQQEEQLFGQLMAIDQAEVKREEPLNPILQGPQKRESYSQLPDLTRIKFNIRISQVESSQQQDEQGSKQNRNRVQYHPEDSYSIISEEQPEEDSNSNKPRTELEKMGSRDLKAGDLLLAGPSYHSATKNYLESLLTEYKFMFKD